MGASVLLLTDKDFEVCTDLNAVSTSGSSGSNMAKKEGKKTKGKVEEILGHRRNGYRMQLKVQTAGGKNPKWVDADESGAPKKMLSEYKKKVKKELAEKNAEKQVRREAAKPVEKASKRGRSVKKVNYRSRTQENTLVQ